MPNLSIRRTRKRNFCSQKMQTYIKKPDSGNYTHTHQTKNTEFSVATISKVCLISPGTDLPGECALLALGSVPGLMRHILGIFLIHCKYNH